MPSAVLRKEEIVEEVKKLNLSEGTFIPFAWFEKLRKETGKPYLEAIVLLSEIVYWYRPSIIRDVETGKVVEERAKFEGDLLQLSYRQLAERFGLTKRQVKRAMDYLEEVGLIWRELRDVEVNGTTYRNVMFVGLDPFRLKEITFGGE